MTIVSHRRRFIFVKTHKTAGSSLEVALAQFCGSEDVLSPEPNEPARQRLGHPGPRNHLLPLRDYTPRRVLRGLRRRGPLVRFYNHMPAREIRAAVGEETWRSYYTFCFERNPWDKAVSSYFWQSRDETSPARFSEFIAAGGAYRHADFDNYAINGVIAVDRVYRYEELPKALEELEQKLGLDAKLELPRAKGHTRKNRSHYAEMYGDAERGLIEKSFAREIAHFGYTFETARDD